MRPLSTVLLVIFLATGCGPATTPEQLMNQGRFRGTPQEQEKALELAQFASNRENDYGLRCWALRALTRLELVPPEAVQKVGDILTNGSSGGYLKAWSAYALGQMRQKEAIPYFISALELSLDEATAYYVLEGLARVVAVIVQDADMNTRVVEAMNRFAAKRNREVPPIFDLLDEHVINLVVLAVTLERMMPDDKGQRKAASADELYLGVFKALDFIERSKDQFINSYARNKASLERLLFLSYKGAKQSQRPLLLLVAWYSGVLGDNRELANRCAEELTNWLNDADPRLRTIVAWSLIRMDLYSSKAHESLVQKWITQENDPTVLSVLRHLWRQEGKPDALQRIYRVPLEDR